MGFFEFVKGSVRLALRGNRYYWAWLILLIALVVAAHAGVLAVRLCFSLYKA